MLNTYSKTTTTVNNKYETPIVEPKQPMMYKKATEPVEDYRYAFPLDDGKWFIGRLTSTSYPEEYYLKSSDRYAKIRTVPVELHDLYEIVG